MSLVPAKPPLIGSQLAPPFLLHGTMACIFTWIPGPGLLVASSNAAFAQCREREQTHEVLMFSSPPLRRRCSAFFRCVILALRSAHLAFMGFAGSLHNPQAMGPQIPNGWSSFGRPCCPVHILALPPYTYPQPVLAPFFSSSYLEPYSYLSLILILIFIIYPHSRGRHTSNNSSRCMSGT